VGTPLSKLNNSIFFITYIFGGGGHTLTHTHIHTLFISLMTYLTAETSADCLQGNKATSASLICSPSSLPVDGGAVRGT